MRMIAPRFLCIALVGGGIQAVRGQWCEPAACIENGNFDNDCCGIPSTVGCRAGYEMTFTADNGCMWNRGTCCTLAANMPCTSYPRTGDPNLCTSPGRDSGEDCWAGSAFEPCTCGQGSAVETGNTVEWDGTTYFEYTCCHSGGEGEECGDYIGHWFWPVFITILLISICCCVGCCVWCCVKGKCPCNKRPPPQQVVTGTQMQPGVMMSSAQPSYSEPVPVAVAVPMPAATPPCSGDQSYA